MKTLSRATRCALAIATLTGLAGPALAADPDFSVTFPAGWACAGFDLKIDGWFGNNRNERTFREDKFGYVRSISAGTGSTLLYTNMTTGKTTTTKANGAVTHTTVYLPDGSQTISATGHNVLVMYPTDFPPGPSTTLYVGRVTWTNAPPAMGGFSTLQSYSGRTIDICAALQ